MPKLLTLDKEDNVMVYVCSYSHRSYIVIEVIPRTRKLVGYFIFPHNTSTSVTIPTGDIVSVLAILIVTSMSSISADAIHS